VVISAHVILHTNVGLAKEPATLGGGGGRRWVLDLRSGGGARLAHGVGAVHGGGVGGCSGMGMSEGTRVESGIKRVNGGEYGLLCCCGCDDEGGGGI
jgi:hypothetical protein